MTKTLLYARESVAFDHTIALVDSDGNALNITGWTFALDLTRQSGGSDFTLGMAASSGDQGLEVVDGSTGALRIVIDQATLAGVTDTTGDFTLFGDLLGTPSGGIASFVADIRLNVTVAGIEFPGSSYRVTLDAVGAVFLAEMQEKLDAAEAAKDVLELNAGTLDITAPLYVNRRAVNASIEHSGGEMVRAVYPDGTGFDNLRRRRSFFHNGTCLKVDDYPLYVNRAAAVSAISYSGGEIIAARGAGSPGRDLMGASTSASAAASGAAFVAIGDSMTKLGIGSAFATVSGRAGQVEAIGGQTSRLIAARIGAFAVPMTVSGNSIASGANTVTHFNSEALAAMTGTFQKTCWQFLSTPSDATTRSCTGYYGAIHGTLTRSAASVGGAESYTFTPDEDTGLPFAVAADTPFVADFDLDERLAILWAGPNDLDFVYRTQWQEAIAAMVARIGHGRFVLIDLPLGDFADERSGGAVYDEVLWRNQWLRETYPRNTLPMLDMVLLRGLEDLGVMPTAQDITDLADGIYPASFRTDTRHPTAAGFTVLGGYLDIFCTTRGF